MMGSVSEFVPAVAFPGKTQSYPGNYLFRTGEGAISGRAGRLEKPGCSP